MIYKCSIHVDKRRHIKNTEQCGGKGQLQLSADTANISFMDFWVEKTPTSGLILKVPKREIFVAESFTISDPICVGDLGT